MYNERVIIGIEGIIGYVDYWWIWSLCIGGVVEERWYDGCVIVWIVGWSDWEWKESMDE